MKRTLAIAALVCVMLGSSARAESTGLAEPATPDTLAAPDKPPVQAAPDTLAAAAMPAVHTAKADDRSDKVPRRIPMVSLALSAVFPGGGQLYTQKYFRAAAFAATLGYYGYRYYREDRAMQQDITAANTAPDEAAYWSHVDSYDRHYNNRRSAQWWGIGVWLFSMADAYIDAHMFKFDEHGEPPLTLRATPASLALCARF